MELPAAPPTVTSPRDMSDALIARMDGSSFRAPAALAGDVSRRLEDWSRTVTSPSRPRLVVQLDEPGPGGVWLLSVTAPSAKRQTVPIDAALRAEREPAGVGRVGATRTALLPAPPIGRAASRAGRAGPGRGVGVHDRFGSCARRCRVRRAGTAAVATSSDAVAAPVRRATSWVGGRSSPAQQRRVVGALRRRRAHRGRRGPPRPSGPPAGAIRPRLGRDRPADLEQAAAALAERGTRQPAHRRGDPAPRASASTDQGCTAVSRCTATVGPATSSAGPAPRRQRS